MFANHAAQITNHSLQLCWGMQNKIFETNYRKKQRQANNTRNTRKWIHVSTKAMWQVQLWPSGAGKWLLAWSAIWASCIPNMLNWCTSIPEVVGSIRSSCWQLIRVIWSIAVDLKGKFTFFLIVVVEQFKIK